MCIKQLYVDLSTKYLTLSNFSSVGQFEVPFFHVMAHTFVCFSQHKVTYLQLQASARPIAAGKDGEKGSHAPAPFHFFIRETIDGAYFEVRILLHKCLGLPFALQFGIQSFNDERHTTRECGVKVSCLADAILIVPDLQRPL